MLNHADIVPGKRGGNHCGKTKGRKGTVPIKGTVAKTVGLSRLSKSSPVVGRTKRRVGRK